MTRDDLKPGYVVRTRDGKFLLVAETSFEKYLMDMRIGAFPLKYWLPDMRKFSPFIDGRNPCDIMEVYGLPYSPSDVLTVRIDTRELLWKRSEPKKMTMEEICEALGYDVEIVKEVGNND